jgi:hypothetical protein
MALYGLNDLKRKAPFKVRWAKGLYFAHHGCIAQMVGKKIFCPPYEYYEY